MRVCVVSSLYHPELGGLGRQAVALTEAIAASGVETFVITRRISGAPAVAFARDVERVELSTPWPNRRVLERRSLANLIVSLAFSIGCRRTLRRRRADYDLVHFHGASLPFLLSIPVLERLGKPVLAKVAATGLGTEAGSFSGRYLGLGALLARRASRAGGFIAISEGIRSGLVAEGVPEDHVHRAANFVDCDRFRPLTGRERGTERRRLGLGDETVVVFSGRLVRRKGVHDLLRAWSMAADARRGGERLLVLGDGPERRRLVDEAAALGISDSVRFLGHQDAPERFLGLADLFVLPSHAEGMPNALLEALACGLPAIASRIDGVLDVASTVGGVELVTPGDPNDLHRALSCRLPRIAELGERSAERRETIRHAYSLEARVETYRGIYRRLLGTEGESDGEGRDDA